jgi:hypothetical protein
MYDPETHCISTFFHLKELSSEMDPVAIRLIQKDFVNGIDRPFGGGVESILIRSLLVNWRLGYFFILF